MQGNCPQIVGRTLGWTAGGKIFPFRSQFPSLMVDCAVPDIKKFEVNLKILCLVCCLVIKESVHRSIVQIQNQKLLSRFQISFFVLPLLLNQCQTNISLQALLNIRQNKPNLKKPTALHRVCCENLCYLSQAYRIQKS